MTVKIELGKRSLNFNGSPEVLDEIRDFFAPLVENTLSPKIIDDEYRVKKRDGYAGLIKNGEVLFRRPFPGGFLIRLESELSNLYLKSAQTQPGILLHAAAVEIEGDLLVFCGSSNSGKTTSIQFLLPECSTFLSDEYVRIDLEQNKVIPFPRPLNSRHKPINDDFFGWRQYVNRLGQDFYYGYPPDEYLPGGQLKGPITMIFLHFGDTSNIQPISRAEGICQLLEGKLGSFTGGIMSGIKLIEKRNVSFYRLNWSKLSGLDASLKQLVT